MGYDDTDDSPEVQRVTEARLARDRDPAGYAAALVAWAESTGQVVRLPDGTRVRAR